MADRLMQGLRAAVVRELNNLFLVTMAQSAQLGPPGNYFFVRTNCCVRPRPPGES